MSIGVTRIDKAHIFDAGNNLPELRRREWTDPETGERKYSKSAYVKQEKWVHRSGTVANVSIACGTAQAEQLLYAGRTREVLRQRGSIPYGQCPLATGDLPEAFFPEDIRDQCRRNDGYGERKGCPHVEHAIARWTAGHQRDAKIADQRQDGIKVRELAAQENQSSALVQQSQAITKMVEALAAGQTASKPAKTGRRKKGAPVITDPDEDINDDG